MSYFRLISAALTFSFALPDATENFEPEAFECRDNPVPFDATD